MRVDHFSSRSQPGCVAALAGVAGLDWNVRDNNGDYPVTIALEWGLAGILETILAAPEDQLDLSVRDLYGDNVGQIAVESSEGERQRCFQLISQVERVDWNLENSYGEAPLMFCLKTNKTDMARVLLSKPQVDLDTVDANDLHLEDIARWDYLYEER